MKELKTLKDLKEKHGIFGPDYVGLKEIKAEAVKWAKYCTYKANERIADYLDVQFWCAKRVVLMEFFNLTDKDLKENEE